MTKPKYEQFGGKSPEGGLPPPQYGTTGGSSTSPGRPIEVEDEEVNTSNPYGPLEDTSMTLPLHLEESDGGKCSLAPRTRQAVRTVSIALVSAVLIVGIFQLARFAEHSSLSKSNGAPEETELVILEEPQGEAASRKQLKPPLPPIRAVKSRAGKVIVTDDDHYEKSASQDEVVMHPELGVPVIKNFMDIDIKRKEKLIKRYSRPANSSEIQKTLGMVRRLMESDRKQLNDKHFRLWTPSDTPLRILLVTTWRSGSTFLGQILASHPGVFHHYEPLSMEGIRQVRSGREAYEAQQLLHRLLECRYQGLDRYLNYTKNHAEDIMSHNKVVWDGCRKGPNPNACFNATFLSESCSMFPIQLVKTVRLRLNLTTLFLNDEKMNMKVVFLVRDPRATMSSRYSSVSWCRNSTDCISPEALCQDLQGDLKVAQALKHLYPHRFTMLKYEDLASDPQTEIGNLFNFLGLEYSPKMSKYVKEHTEDEVEAPWSTKRKSADRVAKWKKQLPLEEVFAIQNSCESVIKTLNYELMGL